HAESFAATQDGKILLVGDSQGMVNLYVMGETKERVSAQVFPSLTVLSPDIEWTGRGFSDSGKNIRVQRPSAVAHLYINERTGTVYAFSYEGAMTTFRLSDWLKRADLTP